LCTAYSHLPPPLLTVGLVELLPALATSTASDAKPWVLQQMQEHAIDFITHSTQDFEAFQDVGSVLNQIPAY
jgi:hypothetical protein